MLARADGLLLQNLHDDRIIRDLQTSPHQREAARRRLLGRRRDAARLLAESPLRTDCLLDLFDQLCDIQRRVDRIVGGRQKALCGELADLLDRMGETPATLARRVSGGKASRQAHDAAKRVLLCGNLRLVVSIAKRFCHRGVSLLDLVQEGNLGLMRAIDKADCRFDCRFSHYAASWITHMIRLAVGEHAGPIKMPPYAIQATARMRTLAGHLSQDTGHPPNADELAEATGLPAKKLFNLMQIQRQPLRLSCYGDERYDDHDGIEAWPLADPRQQSAACEASQMELRERIEEVLQVLPDKQQAVIRLRFGLTDRRDRTLHEVGQMLSLTRERIRQLEHDAMVRLRSSEVSRRLAGFLAGEVLCGTAADLAVSK
jgi:RNA polymerase primary sigma factor